MRVQPGRAVLQAQTGDPVSRGPARLLAWGTKGIATTNSTTSVTLEVSSAAHTHHHARVEPAHTYCTFRSSPLFIYHRESARCLLLRNAA